jgi:hypothetical protein
MTDQTATEVTEAPGPRCDSNRHPEHPGFTCGEVDQTRLFWDSRWAKGDAKPEPIEADTCRPIEVDGETVRVRGSGELTEEGQEALADLVRVAKTRFVAEAPERVGVLQERLRRAHQTRRAKEHQLDDIRRALRDAGFMEDDDPYSHADLADVIRQAGEAVQAESGRLRERLRLLTDEKVAYVTGPTTDLLCEEINRLKAEVSAARKFAGEMRDFCSPHGVSVGYADQLLESMDRAKTADPGPPGTVRGPVPAEYVRLKGQLEADLRKMAACAAQPPRPGAEEVRAMQGGITAGICSSLARAIQCFEGPAARGAFLKRVERTEVGR